MGATMRRAIGVLVLAGSLAFPAAVGAQVTVDGCYAHLSGTGGPDVYYPDGSWQSDTRSDFTDEFRAIGTYRVVWVENGNLTETFKITDCPREPDLTDDPNALPVWDDTTDPPVVSTAKVRSVKVKPVARVVEAPVYVMRLARRP